MSQTKFDERDCFEGHFRKKKKTSSVSMIISVGGSSWNVLQLVQDLMESKPIVELHTF